MARIGIGRWLAQAAEKLTAMRHGKYGVGWLLLNRTTFDYEASVVADANSIILACIGWIQRNFSEAPAMLEEWNESRQDWDQHRRDPFLDLLERPNRFYNGTTLMKATIADRILNGTAYWLKVRSRTGRVVELWWAPASTITPKGDDDDPTVFIDHYDYNPGGSFEAIHLRVEDVVRFPDGLDPADPRKGFSRIRGLFREIFTDDEAANMTASLLRNMGVPGVIISPKQGTLTPEQAVKVKDAFLAKFSGDKKGEPMVMQAEATIQQFGFSPEQMQMRSLRGIPEERITAVLGVNAAVVGLGAGLATTKVGATLREYREEAMESTVCPLYRELAGELSHQLLPDFKVGADWRLGYDLSRVRVLQDDETARSERIQSEVLAGIITVAEGRHDLGKLVLPEHEIYLRPSNSRQVPTGALRVQTGEPPPLSARAKAVLKDFEDLLGLTDEENSRNAKYVADLNKSGRR